MPTWAKYAIAFLVGVLIARDPAILSQIAHQLEQVLNGHG